MGEDLHDARQPHDWRGPCTPRRRGLEDLQDCLITWAPARSLRCPDPGEQTPGSGQDICFSHSYACLRAVAVRMPLIEPARLLTRLRAH